MAVVTRVIGWVTRVVGGFVTMRGNKSIKIQPVKLVVANVQLFLDFILKFKKKYI
jgi:hypothetical protein